MALSLVLVFIAGNAQGTPSQNRFTKVYVFDGVNDSRIYYTGSNRVIVKGPRITS